VVVALVVAPLGQRKGSTATPGLATKEQKGAEQMMTKQERIARRERPELSTEHLDAEQVTVLPAREELSLVNANIAAPINAALALNVLSDNSIAYANAVQTAPIVQGI
jgi:hypothetical protein